MRRSLAALALAVLLPFPVLAPAAALANVVVKPGETLSEIADRHGISLTRLMQANGITNPNVITAGQTLRLPGSSAAATGSTRGGSVTVQPGDTLSDIADRQGVSLNQLMQANGITNPNILVAGQKLVLPGSRRATAAAAPRALPTAPYTVKSGETLSEIADRFGTSTERLIKINGISNPNLVVAGTRLAIPGRPSSSAAPRNSKEHVVRSGESLSSIAGSYGLPVERLVAINKIDDPDLVVSGTRLKLLAPPPVKATPKPAAQAKPKPKPAATPVAKTTPVATPAPKPTVTTALTTAVTPAVATAVPAPKPKPTPQPTPTVQEPIQQPVQQSVQQPVQQSVQPAAKPVVFAAAQPKIQPTPKPSPVVATPIAKASTTTTTSPASRPSTGSKPSSSKPQGPDWRSYGPLQVDWANWQPMGGSFVAPTLNGDGKPVYLAVNCGARKLNATSQSGQWKSWDAPQSDFEEQLISDICKARAS
jgi:LysM repeat protein